MAATASLTPAEAKQGRALFERYRTGGPSLFMREVLGLPADHIWAKMDEINASVRDNAKTAVFAGHGVSKSFDVARVALWFLYCHYPSTVITTAPSNDQVENILWREIRSAHSNAKIPLGGQPITKKLDLGEKWFAYGFATKPDTVTQEATRFQGYHNDHIMVIFDEAAGIMPQIWKAARHLLTSGHWRWVAIGNPTSPYGSFADCKKDPTWHCVTVSVKDTPNFIEGREVIPGVSGRAYEQDIREKHGIESNEYKIRILGQIPEFGEGTFYGREMARVARENRVGFFQHEPTMPVYTFWDTGSMYTAIWFAQFIQAEIRLIDFIYDPTGQGLPHYATQLQRKDYRYAEHWVGPDLDPQHGSNRKSFQTGKTTVDEAKRLGIPFKIITKHRVEDRIAAVRSILSTCRFNEGTCKDGIEAMCQFRRRKNELLSTAEKPVYFEEPVKDWTRHVADAFGHLAMAYRYNLKVDGIRIGYPHAIPAAIGLGPQEADADDWTDEYLRS